LHFLTLILTIQSLLFLGFGASDSEVPKFKRRATLRTCSGCGVSIYPQAIRFLREDCGKNGDQIDKPGRCWMFPELYIEFEYALVPMVKLHEEDDDVINLSLMTRDDMIEVFTSRRFIQITDPAPKHEESKKNDAPKHEEPKKNTAPEKKKDEKETPPIKKEEEVMGLIRETLDKMGMLAHEKGLDIKEDF